jgi:hypothetical protein
MYDVFRPAGRQKGYIAGPPASAHGGAMRSEDLTPGQAQALKERLRPMLAYLGRLEKRMHKRHFPPDDKLVHLVRDAYNAMHALNVEVHYLSCISGAGLPSKSGGESQHRGDHRCREEQSAQAESKRSADSKDRRQ